MSGFRYFPQVVLQSHLDGTVAGYDSSLLAATGTLRGTAIIDTTDSAIGVGCLSTLGAGDTLDFVGITQYAFGSADFTVEGRIKTTDTAGGVIDFYGSGSHATWQVFLEAGKFSWYGGSTGGVKILGSTSSVNTGSWVSFRFARRSGTLYCYINGVKETSAADATVYSFVSAKLSYLRQLSGSPAASSDVLGKLDEVRILNGIALSTGETSYTVDTSPFPDFGEIAPTSFNGADKAANVDLTNGGLTVATFNAHCVRTFYAMSAGKWHWSVKIDVAGSQSAPEVGICTVGHSLTAGLGQDSESYMYYGNNGQKWFNNVGTAYSTAYTTGDVIDVELDMDNRTLKFFKNGVDLGVAYSGLGAGPWYPSYSGGSSATPKSQATFNFGGSMFPYPNLVSAGFNYGVGAPYSQVSGNVKDSTGSNVARKIYLYNEATGAFLGYTTSNASTGNFSMNTPHNGKHVLVFLEADGGTHNALVRSGVMPT